MAGKNFAYKECLLSETAPRVYGWKQGQRVIGDQEYSMLTVALGKTIVTKRNVCGADKAVQTLKVSTPAGVAEYVDSFYSCQAKAVYIDNIDGVFEVLRNFPKP